MPVAIPLAIAGASVAGAAISSRASQRAGQQISNATDAATAEQRRQFDEMRRLAMPGYNRAEAAAGVYGQALGLGAMTGGQAYQPAGQQYGTAAGYQGASSGYQGSQTAYGRTSAMQTLEGADGPDGMSYQGMMTGGADPQVQPLNYTGQAGAGGVTGGGQLDIAQQVMNTPGYQAQLDQGIRSIDRAAPLTGGMYSGRRMKALNNYGQQTFGAYYDNWMNRVGGIAGQAPVIAQNIGQAGQNSANSIGQLMMTGARARADGINNSAQAWGSAFGDAAGAGGYFYGQGGRG